MSKNKYYIGYSYSGPERSLVRYEVEGTLQEAMDFADKHATGGYYEKYIYISDESWLVVAERPWVSYMEVDEGIAMGFRYDDLEYETENGFYCEWDEDGPDCKRAIQICGDI